MAPIPKGEYCARMGEEIKSGAFWRDCFAELVAVFFLVSSSLFLVQHGPTSPTHIALGTTFIWAAVGYAFGDYGGANVSPAITFSYLIRGEVTFMRAIFYWVLQTGGSICATFFVIAITPLAAIHPGIGNDVLGADVTVWQALAIEAFVTTIFCLTALGSLNIHRKGYVILSSLPVGMAAGIGTFIALPFTGASMNPAEAFGVEVVRSILSQSSIELAIWIYWAGPMAGAFLAAILYWVFDSVDKQKTSIYGTWSYAGNKGKAGSKEALTHPNDTGYPYSM